jgi:hypothetical protein
MKLDDLLKVMLAGGSLAAGAALTALRAKLTSTKHKNWLHWIFYSVSGLIILATLGMLSVYWKEIEKPPFNYFAIVVAGIAIISSISLIVITKKLLVGKHHYKTSELDPVVNKFTKNADKGNIKLLAGDLDFWGSGQQMDQNSQYVCLRQEAFREIQILCIRPLTNNSKMIYGKILSDFPQAELRYYQPTKADLNVRGRIKTLGNVTRLLIYRKVASRVYQAVELDTADSDGAHYSLLWNLIWEIAEELTPAEENEYKQLYNS